jgi:hypothetical protein
MAKTQTTVNVPKTADVMAFVTEEKSGIDQSLDLIRRMELRKHADLEFASNALQEVAKRHDALDGKRKSWVDPLNAVVKDINATLKPLIDALKEAEGILKDKIGRYAVTLEQARTKLLADAGDMAKANPSQAESMIAQAAALEPPKVKGVTVSTEWAGEVVDEKLIPREYLVPNVEMLNAMTKAKGSDPGIPGWKAYPKANVRTARK